MLVLGLTITGCTAWPSTTLLLLLTQKKVKKEIYPLPLAATRLQKSLTIKNASGSVCQVITASGATVPLQAINQDGTNVASSATWSFSNTSGTPIASVSAAGIINMTNGTINASDTGTVTGSYDGASAQFAVKGGGSCNILMPTVVSDSAAPINTPPATETLAAVPTSQTQGATTPATQPTTNTESTEPNQTAPNQKEATTDED